MMKGNKFKLHVKSQTIVDGKQTIIVKASPRGTCFDFINDPSDHPQDGKDTFTFVISAQDRIRIRISYVKSPGPYRITRTQELLRAGLNRTYPAYIYDTVNIDSTNRLGTKTNTSLEFKIIPSHTSSADDTATPPTFHDLSEITEEILRSNISTVQKPEQQDKPNPIGRSTNTTQPRRLPAPAATTDALQDISNKISKMTLLLEPISKCISIEKSVADLSKQLDQIRALAVSEASVPSRDVEAEKSRLQQKLTDLERENQLLQAEVERLTAEKAAMAKRLGDILDSTAPNSPSAIAGSITGLVSAVQSVLLLKSHALHIISADEQEQLIEALSFALDELSDGSEVCVLMEALRTKLQASLQEPINQATEYLDQGRTVDALDAVTSQILAFDGSASHQLGLKQVHDSLYSIVQAAWKTANFAEHRPLFEELLTPLSLTLIVPARGDSYSVRHHRREGRKNISGLSRNKIVEVCSPGIACGDGEVIEKSTVIVSG